MEKRKLITVGVYDESSNDCESEIFDPPGYGSW